MSAWEEYYEKRSDMEIPWDLVRPRFIKNLWKKFNLPDSGRLLDIGCGRGSKSIYFAQNNFDVWGIDISKSAIDDAIQFSRDLTKKPTFIVGDISKLDSIGELKGLKFDIILDKLSSQFLDDDIKKSYIHSLNKHLEPDSYFILQIFGKPDSEKDIVNIPEWIRKVYRSRAEVNNIYGKFLEMVDFQRGVSAEGILVDTYVLKNSSYKSI